MCKKENEYLTLETRQQLRNFVKRQINGIMELIPLKENECDLEFKADYYMLMDIIDRLGYKNYKTIMHNGVGIVEIRYVNKDGYKFLLNYNIPTQTYHMAQEYFE